MLDGCGVLLIRNGTDDGRTTERCREGVAMNCVVRSVASIVHPFVHPFVRFRETFRITLERARPDPSPFDRSRSIVRPRGRVSRFSDRGRFACADDATRTIHRLTDGPTDRRTRANPETGTRVASQRIEITTHRKEPHNTGCAVSHPFHSFIHPFRVVSRTKEKKKKKRHEARSRPYLRGNRAADGLLRRRRALGERDEAGVQSEGNHDYLRSCVDRSADRGRVRGRVRVVGRSVKFSIRATLWDGVYQERNVKF